MLTSTTENVLCGMLSSLGLNSSQAPQSDESSPNPDTLAQQLSSLGISDEYNAAPVQTIAHARRVAILPARELGSFVAAALEAELGSTHPDVYARYLTCAGDLADIDSWCKEAVELYQHHQVQQMVLRARQVQYESQEKFDWELNKLGILLKSVMCLRTPAEWGARYRSAGRFDYLVSVDRGLQACKLERLGRPFLS